MSNLKIKDISYAYLKDKPILKDLSLEIKTGECVALLGPSGYGKSTLALLLAHYLKMQKGEILLDEKPVAVGGYYPIQLIYQQADEALNPHLKIKDSLDEAWDIPSDLVEAIGADPSWLSRWPNELSGGQLQRLSILRALNPKTKILIADEITASLDPITQAQIWQLILREVKKHSMSLLVITHNEVLAERICTRMVHIKEINKV